MNEKPRQERSSSQPQTNRPDRDPRQSCQEETADDQPLFPMRINKYLALEGRGSRREMDKIIAEGKVTINGREAVLGDKVNEGDKVEIKFRAPRKSF